MRARSGFKKLVGLSTLDNIESSHEYVIKRKAQRVFAQKRIALLPEGPQSLSRPRDSRNPRCGRRDCLWKASTQNQKAGLPQSQRILVAPTHAHPTRDPPASCAAARKAPRSA